MAGRALRATARILFAVCGLTTLLTAVPYAMLRGAGLPVQSEWVFFVAAMGAAGLWSLAQAVLPRFWAARLSRSERDDPRVFSAPLKLLAGLAAAGYLVAVFAHNAPQRWDLDPQLMLVLCPMYLVKMSFDPPAETVLLILAPMNAAVYASFGIGIRSVWLALRPGSPGTDASRTTTEGS